MKRRPLRAAWLASFLLLAASSCKDAVNRLFAQPTVAFRGVDVGSIGVTGGALDVVLRVSNPNPYQLSAKRVTYTLLAEWVRNPGTK